MRVTTCIACSVSAPRLCSWRSHGSGVEDTMEALPDVSKEFLGPLKFPWGSTAGYTHRRAGAGAPHHLIWSLDSRLGCLVEPLASILSAPCIPLGAAAPSPSAPAAPGRVPPPLDPPPLPSSIPPLAHLIPCLSGVHPLHAPMMLRVATASFLAPKKWGWGGLGAAISPALFSCRFYSHSHSHQISHGPEAPRLQGLY